MSAFVRIFSLRHLSAQPISVAKSPVIVGATVGTLPIITSPVVPLMVRNSPALTSCPAMVMVWAFSSILTASQPTTQRLAPAAGDDRGVARLAAGAGEDALRQVHAGHVFGAGLLADEQDRLVRVLRGVLDHRVGGEETLPDAAAGAGRDALGHRLDLRLRVELRLAAGG